jgi:hypothetical protein
MPHLSELFEKVNEGEGNGPRLAEKSGDKNLVGEDKENDDKKDQKFEKTISGGSAENSGAVPRRVQPERVSTRRTHPPGFRDLTNLK